MDLEEQIREAVIAELTRQSESSEGRLKVQPREAPGIEVHGVIDLDALSMVIVGSVAGGP